MPRHIMQICALIALALLSAVSRGQVFEAPRRSVEVQQKLNKARVLVQFGQYDEATQQYSWLWDHMLEHDPAMHGVRLSFMVGDMQELASMHEPALALFTEKRDRLDPAIQEGIAGFNTISDWIALNEVINDEQRTVDWVLSLGNRENGAELFDRAGHDAEDILLDRGEYALYAKLVPDLVQDAKVRIKREKTLERFLEEKKRKDRMPPQARQMNRLLFHREIAKLYLVCLKTDRLEEASEIAEVLLRDFDTEDARLTLIRTALGADAAQPQHLDWIDEMEELSTETKTLRKRVAEALANAAPDPAAY